MTTSKRPYHDHLDVCRRCADHPFALCPVWAKALLDEAAEIDPEALRAALGTSSGSGSPKKA